MPPNRPVWQRAVAVEPEPTTLSARATQRLRSGPLDSVTLMREVCHVDRLTHEAAERMAMALLGTRPEFVRVSNGAWALRSDPVLDSATSETADGGVDDSDLMQRDGVERVYGESYTYPETRDDKRVRELAPRVVTESDPLLASLSFAVVDVETTGTSARTYDRITEISIVRVIEGRIADVYTRLVNPERSIPPFITSLTQISWDMVKDEPPFRHIAHEVAERLTGHVFTAHNAAFDWGFVSEELSRSARGQLQGPRLCTVRLAKALLPTLSRRSLDSVTNHFGIEVSSRHRAEGDAVATAQCLLRMLKVAEEREVHTWSALASIVGPMQPRKKTASDRRRRAFPQPVTKDDVA
ncbi:MAG: PolC-type DNA polymerase III [Gemmatimonas sp.]